MSPQQREGNTNGTQPREGLGSLVESLDRLRGHAEGLALRHELGSLTRRSITREGEHDVLVYTFTRGRMVWRDGVFSVDPKK
jgi:hypothetical protein